jgi:ParB family chromosome partitioning protein
MICVKHPGKIMAAQKKGLGRGLDALLGGSGPAAAETVPDSMTAAAPLSAAQNAVPGGMREIALDMLRPGEYQPRRDMHKETLEELAASIREQGVLAPISVRPVSDATGTKYEIIAGERRWRASQLAGLATIPAVIRNVDDEGAAAIALIENLQREDLNALEEAEGLVRLIDEFDLTHQEAGRAVGKSRAAVSNLIRLLELCPEARQMLASGQLDMGHARALLALPASRSQAEAAREVAGKGLSVRQTEALVKRLLAGGSVHPAKSAPAVDRDIQRLENELGDKLGAKVAIQRGAKGKGKLVISYNSNDELEGILGHIK